MDFAKDFKSERVSTRSTTAAELKCTTLPNAKARVKAVCASNEVEKPAVAQILWIKGSIPRRQKSVAYAQ
eukprot:773471-Pleurochrysis_carterae.AAC.2